MPDYLEHLKATILALEQELAADPRHATLRELRRIYETNSTTDSPATSVAPAPTGAMPTHRPPTREMRAETKETIEASERFVKGRIEPVPTREIYHHVVSHGCHIGGANPINGLSAILSRSGKFLAHGRSGWTLASEPSAGRKADDDPPEPQGRLQVAPRSNGSLTQEGLSMSLSPSQETGA